MRNIYADIKTLLLTQLHCKTVDPATKYLGIRITRDRSERAIYLDQEEYIATLLVKYGMAEASNTKTPMNEWCKLTKVFNTGPGLSAIIHWTEMIKLFRNHNGRPVSVMEDNQQCIRWIETDMINVHNRAVEVKYHRRRQYFKDGWFKVIFTSTNNMITDALGRILLEIFRDQINVVPIEHDHYPTIVSSH